LAAVGASAAALRVADVHACLVPGVGTAEAIEVADARFAGAASTAWGGARRAPVEVASALVASALVASALVAAALVAAAAAQIATIADAESEDVTALFALAAVLIFGAGLDVRGIGACLLGQADSGSHAQRVTAGRLEESSDDAADLLAICGLAAQESAEPAPAAAAAAGVGRAEELRSAELPGRACSAFTSTAIGSAMLAPAIRDAYGVAFAVDVAALSIPTLAADAIASVEPALLVHARWDASVVWDTRGVVSADQPCRTSAADAAASIASALFSDAVRDAADALTSFAGEASAAAPTAASASIGSALLAEAVRDASDTGADGCAEVSRAALSAESPASIWPAVLSEAAGLARAAAGTGVAAGRAEGAVAAGASAAIVSALFPSALRHTAGDDTLSLGGAFQITATESAELAASIVAAFLERAIGDAFL